MNCSIRDLNENSGCSVARMGHDSNEETLFPPIL